MWCDSAGSGTLVLCTVATYNGMMTCTGLVYIFLDVVLCTSASGRPALYKWAEYASSVVKVSCYDAFGSIAVAAGDGRRV